METFQVHFGLDSTTGSTQGDKIGALEEYHAQRNVEFMCIVDNLIALKDEESGTNVLAALANGKLTPRSNQSDLDSSENAVEEHWPDVYPFLRETSRHITNMRSSGFVDWETRQREVTERELADAGYTIFKVYPELGLAVIGLASASPYPEGRAGAEPFLSRVENVGFAHWFGRFTRLE